MQTGDDILYQPTGIPQDPFPKNIGLFKYKGKPVYYCQLVGCGKYDDFLWYVDWIKQYGEVKIRGGSHEVMGPLGPTISHAWFECTLKEYPWPLTHSPEMEYKEAGL